MWQRNLSRELQGWFIIFIKRCSGITALINKIGTPETIYIVLNTKLPCSRDLLSTDQLNGVLKIWCIILHTVNVKPQCTHLEDVMNILLLLILVQLIVGGNLAILVYILKTALPNISTKFCTAVFERHSIIVRIDGRRGRFDPKYWAVGLRLGRLFRGLDNPL